MDEEFKKLLAGNAWAESGDRVDPSAVSDVSRANGFASAYSSTEAPPRTLVNQLFRELYGAAKEVGLGVSQYDSDVSYPVGAVTQVNGKLYYASAASDSTNPVSPVTSPNSTWQEMGGIGELPSAATAIDVGDIYIDGSLASRFSVYWSEPDNGNSPITTVDMQYSKSSSFPSASTTTLTNYLAGTAIDLSADRDSDLYYVRLRFNNTHTDTTTDSAVWSAGKQVLSSPLAPDAISSLRAVGDIGDGLVDLDWSAPYARGLSITNYTVEWRTSVGIWNSTTTTSTSYQVSGLTNDIEYSFRVTANSNRSTQSPLSNVVTATPRKNPDIPDAPSIAAQAAGYDAVLVNLTSIPEDHNALITRFRWQIKRSGDSWDNPNSITTEYGNAPIHEFDNLIAGSSYDVRCSAYNGTGDSDSDPDDDGEGYSAWSNSVNVSTQSFASPSTPVIAVSRDKQGRIYYGLGGNINSTGGSNVTNFDLQYKPSTDSDYTTLSDLTSPFGVINNTDTSKAYDIQMRASNSTRDSGYGSISIGAVASVPSKPVIYLHEGEIQYQSGGSPTSIARHVYATAVSDDDGGRDITRWEFRSTSSVSGSLDNDYIHTQPVGNVGFALRTRTLRVQGRTYNGFGDSDNNPEVGNAGWSPWSDVKSITIT